MSLDQVIRFVLLGVLAIVLCWQVARRLRTGRLKLGAVIYERREEPIEFWLYVAFTAIVIALLLWQLADVFRDASHPRAGFLLLLFVLAAPAAFVIVRGIRTGSMGFGGSKFSRRAAPRQYWGLLLAHAAVVFAVVAVGLWYFSPREPTYEEVVEPVVKAVRDGLSGERSLEFRNVRVDGRSRLVCGEVLANRRTTRRFFGNADRNVGNVRLEDESLDFERAHRRACGAPGEVPPQG